MRRSSSPTVSALSSMGSIAWSECVSESRGGNAITCARCCSIPHRTKSSGCPTTRYSSSVCGLPSTSSRSFVPTAPRSKYFHPNGCETHFRRRQRELSRNIQNNTAILIARFASFRDADFFMSSSRLPFFDIINTYLCTI